MKKLMKLINKVPAKWRYIFVLIVSTAAGTPVVLDTLSVVSPQPSREMRDIQAFA